MAVKFEFRDMTKSEFKREQAAFDECGLKFGSYFYLSDLLVEKEYRKLGYGKRLLELLENKIYLKHSRSVKYKKDF